MATEEKQIDQTPAVHTPPEPPPPATPAVPAVRGPRPGDDATEMGFNSGPSFALMNRVATALASSSIVPKEYQERPANCMIALDMANRIGAAPLMVMQNLFIVNGRPGWSGQFLIATINQCGQFSKLRFQWSGKKENPRDHTKWGCMAWAKEKATGDTLEGAEVTWTMAVAEGWTKKTGSKWLTMPEQMFMYRAASFFVKAYAPELSMGLQSAEELEDIGPETPPDPRVPHFDAEAETVTEETPDKPKGVLDQFVKDQGGEIKEGITEEPQETRAPGATPAPEPHKPAIEMVDEPGDTPEQPPVTAPEGKAPDPKPEPPPPSPEPVQEKKDGVWACGSGLQKVIEDATADMEMSELMEIGRKAGLEGRALRDMTPDQAARYIKNLPQKPKGGRGKR